MLRLDCTNDFYFGIDQILTRIEDKISTRDKAVIQKEAWIVGLLDRIAARMVTLAYEKEGIFFWGTMVSRLANKDMHLLSKIVADGLVRREPDNIA